MKSHGIGENACDRTYIEDYLCVARVTSICGCTGEMHSTGVDGETSNTVASCTTS